MKTAWFKIALSVLLCLAIVCSSGSESTKAFDKDNWTVSIRPDHPRLFFNADTWPSVKQAALGGENELFAELQKQVKELVDKKLDPGDYGREAALAAFVFLVMDDSTYYKTARNLLRTSVDYYNQCYEEKKSVSWYSFSRINAWAAYDWLFNYLPEQERKELGADFLRATANVQPTKDRKEFDRWENWLGPRSGFYSTPSLLWYAGLATWKEGINDSLADSFARRGYELYTDLLSFRSSCAGDDGGSASAALNYSLAAYPWAEFNFFHTFQSATGYNIARDWPYMAHLAGYLFWNWLPGKMYFGIGDSYHESNRIPLGNMHMHLSQVVHFYSEPMPREAAFARYMMGRIDRNDRLSFVFHRFLVSGEVSDIKPQGPPENMPLARHFNNMGQIFFRSGNGDDATYACFTAGGTTEMHKHFDHNNFVIYKKGYQRLDTGTRHRYGIHLSHYYCRTVAHNCVTIKMPGEEMPRYWGYPAEEEDPDLPYPNDGGQRMRGLGSEIKAFEANEYFSYAAGDATEAYHKDKCELALRQFVYFPPDYFVVFDRIHSTQPEYEKRWLIHTATEPQINGRAFTSYQDQGRIFVRSLLPEKARMEKVGGPGRQFMAGGRNWPLHANHPVPDTTQLLGQWRIEVYPEVEDNVALCLHLIQVGDRSMQDMVASELIKDNGKVGLSFNVSGGSREITFGTEGNPSGHVRIVEGGKTVVDRPLVIDVQHQEGLFGM